jgi:hypothetical protein
VGFPRAWITVGLAALGFLLTLVAWLGSFDAGFSIWALLGLLTAAAILLFSLFTLLPQLRNRPALPGALAGAAQWANQQAPDPTAGGRQGGHAYGGPPPPAGPHVTGTATPPTTPMPSQEHTPSSTGSTAASAVPPPPPAGGPQHFPGERPPAP